MTLKEIIKSKRRRPTEVTEDRNLAEELASDRSRIVYSAAFRRLSKKAQVFSLESNAAVRTRITHSLEVSNVGRLIASAVTKKLFKDDAEFQLAIIHAVESACLVHDIGNPPFGHFGEIAIQNWFKANWETCYTEATEKDVDERIKILMEDFRHFDGNPQGLRILLRLKRDKDQYSYNLTYTTILSFIKYVCSPSQKDVKNKLKKKAGYFESERKIVEDMKEFFHLEKDARYPLAYIMEAADDIAYCISDIEDGIEKEILKDKEFFSELRKEWRRKCKDKNKNFPFAKREFQKKDFFYFKIKYTQQAIEKAANYFVKTLSELMKGKEPGLFPSACDEQLAFDSLKNVARKKLFRSPEAENAELAGLQIVTGLLEKFKPLLVCSTKQFDKLLKGRDDPSKVKGLDIEWRLFNRLPPKHVEAYKDQLKEFKRKDFPEWYFRAHLIVDYISGMTDTFALEQYQLLSGIRIVQEK